MHIFTHLKTESEGKTGLGIYADGMVEHDGHVGQLLAKLKELGIEDNTIVMYSTDNGAETFTWPDGGTTMFRGEKNTQWEGGYRVPTLIRWPGVIKPGTVINEIGAHEDMLTTLLAAAGEPNVKEDLLKGKTIGDRDLQGPPRRLRSRARAQGRGGVAAQGVHLLDRRRQRCGAALRQLEDHLPAAERRRPRGLAGAVRWSCARRCSPTCAWIPSSAPSRKTPWATALVHRPHVRHRPRRGLCRPMAAELPGVPAAPEARQLQSRPGDGSGDEQLEAVTPAERKRRARCGSWPGGPARPSKREVKVLYLVAGRRGNRRGNSQQYQAFAFPIRPSAAVSMLASDFLPATDALPSSSQRESCPRWLETPR